MDSQRSGRISLGGLAAGQSQYGVEEEVSDQQAFIGKGEADELAVAGGMPSPLSPWSLAQIIKIALLVAILALVIVCLVFILRKRCCKDVDDQSEDSTSSVTILTLMTSNGCINITALPVTLESYHCYVLGDNFHLDTAIVGITVEGGRAIELFYDNHEITVDAEISALPLSISDSTDVRVYDVHHRALVQSFVAIGAYVYNSTDVYMLRPHIESFQAGVFSRFSSLYLSDLFITATHPGNDESAAYLAGMVGLDMIVLDVRRGSVSIPFAAAAGLSDGPTYGIASTTVENFPFDSRNTLEVTDVHLRAGSPILAEAGAHVVVRGSHIEQDANAILSAGMQLGDMRVVRSAIIEDTTFECVGDVQGGDCVLLWNVRSVEFRRNTIFGKAIPFAGVYRGALLHVDLQFVPLPPNIGEIFINKQEAMLFQDVTVRSSDNDSIAVHVQTRAASPREKSATFRNVVVHGGRAGVVVSNSSSNILFDNVQVSESPFCFAAINGTDGVVIKNSDAFHCCLGYFADESTSAIGLYDNRAVRCEESYRDDGVGNEFGVGFGSEGNNRMLGEIGEEECALLVIDDIVESAESASVSSDSVNAFNRIREMSFFQQLGRK